MNFPDNHTYRNFTNKTLTSIIICFYPAPESSRDSTR